MASAWLYKIASLYRSDNVPLWLRPIFLIYGYGIGWFFRLGFLIVWATSRIQFEGVAIKSIGQKAVFAIWHDSVMVFFCAHPWMGKAAMLQHPDWYMKPILVTLAMAGADVTFLGSTGHGGRSALDQLADFLTQNPDYVTSITPDGPYGPGREIKKGAFHLAQKTGRPLYAVSARASHVVRFPTWDRKALPLPFGKIKIRITGPFEGDPDSPQLAADFKAALSEA